MNIDEITREDSRQLKCVAVNSRGEIDVWFTNITVMGKSKIFAKGLYSQIIIINTSRSSHFFKPINLI